MRSKPTRFPACIALGLVTPASADVIYSYLQDISIPANFAGLYLDVDGSNGWNTNMAAPVAGWDINAYYGGKVLANSPAFQPVRVNGTDNWSPVVDLAAGASVGSGSQFSPFVQGAGGETPGAPGYGTSQMLTTSGGNFTAGTEGYLGFKLYTGANYTVPNYGWMRVVLGGATPVIRDWAYDTSGAAIATGNVLQSGSIVTLNSALGSFTLGSQITGTDSVVKTGDNTVTLTGTNSYSGTTTVANGTLLVNGSLTGSGTVTVAGLATLGGTGGITGNVSVAAESASGMNNGGFLAPGASIGSLASGALIFNTGSTFAYEMNASEPAASAADLQIVNGDLTLNGRINLTLSASAFTPNTTTLALVQYTGSLLGSGGFFYGATALTEGTVFNDGLNNWKISYAAEAGGVNFPNGLGGHFITLSNLTAVPEPGSLLALGCLLGTGTLLRRRRC